MKDGKKKSKVYALMEDTPQVTLERAKVKGSVNVIFWGLRIYIVAMVVLVIIGFTRGTI
ncbi:MAG: hypothetical protein OWS03_03685 [Alicyclobacillaceae bacterium]|nr:hypothetical protein [Alicyclobacillaceae bacterium]